MFNEALKPLRRVLTLSLRVARSRADNGDGSYDPFGPILRMERMDEKEADERIRDLLTTNVGIATYVESDLFDLMDEIAEAEKALQSYAPLGLAYQIDPATGEIHMTYQGKPVHSLYDSQTGIWIANNLYGTDLGPDAIDLEAVYGGGKLTGLRVSEGNSTPAQTAVSKGTEVDEGVPLPDLFDPYKPYGITYEEKETAEGVERNLYYQGNLVNHFADQKPDGGVFTFGSTRQSKDGLIVRTVYENGKLTGLAVN